MNGSGSVGNGENWVQRLAWMVLGALVSAAALVAAEAIATLPSSNAVPQSWHGIWVSDDGTKGLMMTPSRWYAHIVVEGFECVPRVIDVSHATVSGDLRCQTGGQRAGSFVLRRNPQNVNQFMLEILKEGHQAAPPIIMSRPT